MRSFRLLSALLIIGALFLSTAAATPPDSLTFDEGRAGFTVQFGDETISHRIMAVTVRPDTAVRIRVGAVTPETGYRVDGLESSIRPLSSSLWRLLVPSTPGLYPVTIRDTTSEDSIRIQVFVLRPWDHEGLALDGYRIGRYESEPRRGLDVYEPPTGFIRVTDENKNARLSPHFRLNQFLCKQTDRTPQYALIRPRLLKRLEQILAAVNSRGYAVETLHVMSGYRTPQYNRAIGNTTEYSRHLYGDAADIFVDADGDDWMDDLTGDGRVTRADARYLANLVENMATSGDDAFAGGLGIYGPAQHRGPFVHIDLRGYRARW